MACLSLHGSSMIMLEDTSRHSPGCTGIPKFRGTQWRGNL